MTDIDEGNPWPKQGAKWTAYHYRAIIAGLRERRGWREISREIGRTESATRSRAGYLIDDDGRRGTAATRLRARLEEDPNTIGRPSPAVVTSRPSCPTGTNPPRRCYAPDGRRRSQAGAGAAGTARTHPQG
ncbi:hypothetical protein [Nocardia cyriacigeorgica]|uniref:hypothetical protein n=1 Tax=Nocardia cyriacigeorgica TaxID=135487 RepID=UPI0024579462|nr:hypothetical protein [Nocardia cyriacigeorgica]